MYALCGDRPRDSVRSGVVIIMLLALLAAADVATAAQSGCEAHAARTHQVLPADSMDNWEPLDDRTVLIWTKHSRRAYRVMLDRALGGLDDASVIYLLDADHDGRISPCGDSRIVIGGGVQVAQVARIVSIELLSVKRTAELDPGAHATQREKFHI